MMSVFSIVVITGFTTEDPAQAPIRLDADVLDWFRDQVNRAGGGNYQSLINEALRGHIEREKAPLEDTLRRVIREELRKAG